MKNNAIVNTNRVLNEICLMLQSEMWIQKVVKFWDTDGSHILRLFFNNIEYDPDVLFDKIAIFSAFCSKFSFFNETYLNSGVDKKKHA